MGFLRNIKSSLANNFNNIRGCNTNRKIIVIESDDWGATRMPSTATLNRLLKKNVTFDLSTAFDKYDTLASDEDLEMLFEVLCSVKDKNGNYAKITANSIMANPDFQKIKDSEFKQYYYEIFTETLNKYDPKTNIFQLWKKGIESNIFRPQFHGREHLNVPMWLKSLQKNHQGVLTCFEEGVYSMMIRKVEDKREHVLSAYNYQDREDLDFIAYSMKEGLLIFEKLFGYQSKSMIAPCYVWDSEIENMAYQNDIKYIQGGIFQLYPTFGLKKRKRHFMGERNHNDQIYLIRNCSFEPSNDRTIDHVDNCLHKIATAFRWNKPAIINSHRVNYIGRLEKNNSVKNLIILRQLLKSIVNKWPNAEFMFSDELGNVIEGNFTV